MNWCKDHWNQLRQALKDRGLDQFGAKDGHDAAAAIAAQIDGGEEKFDPLLGSWSRINATMAESLTNQGRAGELLQLKCPLCILVEDGQPQMVANWVDGVSDQAKKYAIDQGMLKVS